MKKYKIYGRLTSKLLDMLGEDKNAFLIESFVESLEDMDTETLEAMKQAIEVVLTRRKFK